MNDSLIWAMADAMHVVPTPSNAIVARSIVRLMSRPPLFGCEGAREGGDRFVVAPSAAVLCGDCARREMKRERRCMYCRGEVDPALDLDLIFEMRGLMVFGKAHVECDQAASR